MTTTAVEVVSAAIIRRDVGGLRILLAQRSPDTSYPWAWCTPGGKVEPGENHDAALRRELREELGIGAWPLQEPLFVTEVESSRTSATLTVYCYPVHEYRFYGARVAGDKTEGFGWFSSSDLARLALAPADLAGFADLQRALAER